MLSHATTGVIAYWCTKLFCFTDVASTRLFWKYFLKNETNRDEIFVLLWHCSTLRILFTYWMSEWNDVHICIYRGNRLFDLKHFTTYGHACIYSWHNPFFWLSKLRSLIEEENFAFSCFTLLLCYQIGCNYWIRMNSYSPSNFYRSPPRTPDSRSLTSYTLN